MLVPWKRLDGQVFNRYYYIFEIEELQQLFQQANLKLMSHNWECGNEVFILKKIQINK